MIKLAIAEGIIYRITVENFKFIYCDAVDVYKKRAIGNDIEMSELL